ncbi:MAG: aldehyde dehydrogenase family protein [Chitinophagales bacterium]|nr:aldehyde dehydrogenase family protein [Chitinophagales bacterium]
MEEHIQVGSLHNVGNYQNTDTTVISEIYRKQVEHKEISRHTTVKERIAMVKALMKAVENNKDMLMTAFHNDFRKSEPEVELTEIYPFIKECKLIINNLADWKSPELTSTPITYFGTSSKVVRDSKGNTLIISPWNYPFNLTFLPLVSSIAAGNTVILKPSEYTPHVTSVMKKIISEVFEESEAAIVEGDAEVAQFLLKLRFDHIHFTGSTRVGQIVMKAAAEYHSSVTLELGGKSPTVVDSSADIGTAAKRIIWGKLLNNGQTCIAPDYLLVEENVTSTLVEKLIERIHQQYGADLDAIKQSEDLCRIINRSHYDRLCFLIDDAIENGSKVVFGNERDPEENYISPTILANVSTTSQIMKEEIFGPILPILEFKSTKEALAVIRGRDKPLSMYIFSKNKKNVEMLMDGTSAGSTCVNHCVIQYSHPDLPFGGVNHSGIGKSHGKWAFEEFTYERAVLKQTIKYSPADILFPPYTKTVRSIIDILQKWF